MKQVDELDFEIPDYDLQVLCKCGEKYKFSSMEYYTAKTNHTRHTEKGKHGIKEIINLETGEKVGSEKEAINKNWILSTRDYGKYNKVVKKKNRGKSNKSTEEKRSTILGKLLNTEVYIHPYVYDTFIHAMSIWPERYNEDDVDSFSQYILDLVIFFRLTTDKLLPWGDLVAESIFQEEEQEVDNNG